MIFVVLLCLPKEFHHIPIPFVDINFMGWVSTNCFPKTLNFMYINASKLHIFLSLLIVALQCDIILYI